MSQHTPQTIREALASIPAEDRDLWVRMGAAVHSELGDAGEELWDSWSQTAYNYSARAAKAVWKSFREGGGITIGTLFHEAKQHGFKLNGHGNQIDPAEWDRIRKEREERQRIDAERRAKEEAAASLRAEEILGSSSSASSQHPYLVRKGVQSCAGLRQGNWHQVGTDGARFREKNDCLLVQMRDADGKLWNLQAIFPEKDADLERDKDYLLGGRKQGTYFPIGKPLGVVVIAEGLATALSIRQATGHAVCVAFDKGNLAPVGKALRSKLPDARLIFAADNDIKEGKPNYGVEKANEAAADVRGFVAIPDLAGRKADFNDLHQEQGLDAVRAAIEGARQPAPKEQQEGNGMQTNVAHLADHREPLAAGWPDPEKLPELPDVPEFDYDFLPGPLRAFVRDNCDRMQSPPEFGAVATIVMAGSAIGRNVGIRPKLSDSWTVIPNLWGMLVGKSGIMKSPTQSESLAPLKRMQALAFEKYEDEVAEYEVAERVLKLRGAQAEAEAKKKLAKNRNADITDDLKQDEIEEPKPRRYIVNDSSPEALCETLKDNPQGVLVERDELIGLLKAMDREGNQEARALYLTAADGDKPFTVDRIMRGSGRHIEALCVSMIGGIQPGVLAAYVRETQRSGAGDDGLLQRFGLMVYPDIKGDWQNVDRKPDAAARESMTVLIDRLCNLTAEDVGAEVDPYGGVPFVRFDSAAYAMFVEWLSELERNLRHGDDHPSVASHLSKYRKLVPALALINHLCEGGKGNVTEAAISRALLFTEFLEAHARRVYSYASRPDFDAAKTILAKLRTGKLGMEFTSRDVYRPGWSGLTTAEEAQAAIRVLIDFKHLREKPLDLDKNDKAIGRPSIIYQAHPSTKVAS